MEFFTSAASAAPAMWNLSLLSESLTNALPDID